MGVAGVRPPQRERAACSPRPVFGGLGDVSERWGENRITTMGHNDHLDEDRPELPAEAGADSRRGFEPHDKWIRGAAPELAHEAMRLWFVSRYWDPANDTP